MMERAAIVAWLRRNTHLKGLALFFESGMHQRAPEAVKEYCEKNQLTVRKP